jgi:hypothetical protein
MSDAMGAAVPEPQYERRAHFGSDLPGLGGSRALSDYEQHAMEKYFKEQREEAAKAAKKVKAARADRDKIGRWSGMLPEPRLDWMNLDFDLTVRQVIALDADLGDEMVYRRVQASADDDCRWVGEGDLVTPEGHSSERLMEMWPSGFRVIKNFAPGWEPPHRCPMKPTACPHCRAMKRTES